jgi:hypothetical protein
MKTLTQESNASHSGALRREVDRQQKPRGALPPRLTLIHTPTATAISR